MALYRRLFSLVCPSQFYVQFFKSQLGRITEIPLYCILNLLPPAWFPYTFRNSFNYNSLFCVRTFCAFLRKMVSWDVREDQKGIFPEVQVRDSVFGAEIEIINWVMYPICSGLTSI